MNLKLLNSVCSVHCFPGTYSMFDVELDVLLIVLARYLDCAVDASIIL